MSLAQSTNTHNQQRHSTLKVSGSAPPTPRGRLRYALRYAERGIPVFPCKPGAKEPLTPHGHLDASTDPRRIHAWFNAHPDANIGIPTGERSGILALDVDEWGAGSLDALEREHSPLPETAATRTGGGGMHLLYRYPAAENIRNSTGKLGRDLDVRAEGGYILAPPSRTQSPYEWLDRRPLADPPAWLIKLLREPEGGPGGRAREPGEASTTAITPDLNGPPIPEGTRDDALTSIAGALHDGSRTLEELADALLAINKRRCEPPLPERQVLKIARSIHARTPCKPSTQATPEALEVLDAIEAALWRTSWRGMGELSARDVYVALIVIARQFGTRIPAGVRVSISVRALALAAATSKPTAIKAIRRLMQAGFIRRDDAGRTGTQAGAIVLLPPRANLYHSPTRVCVGESGKTLRAPRLRWSAPLIERIGDEVYRSTIRRLGKGCGAVIDALERAGGSATVEELAEALGKSRTRDLRRRLIARLEASGVVECGEAGDTVALVGEWLDALNRERENAGEIAAYQRDMARYAREREAYTNRHRIRSEPIPRKPPAGEIRELERVGDSAPELLEALAAALVRWPDHRDDYPSWWASTLYFEDYLPYKPLPVDVELALHELEEVAA